MAAPPAGVGPDGETFQGFLTKQDSESTARTTPHWKRRWVVIKRGALYYYKVTQHTIRVSVGGPRETAPKLPHLLGVVPLKNAAIYGSSAPDEAGAPKPGESIASTFSSFSQSTRKRTAAAEHLFAVHASDRDVWFAAASAEDKLAWIDALKAVIAVSSNKDPSSNSIVVDGAGSAGRSPAKAARKRHKWEIPSKDLQLYRKLGEGVFGEVYQGKLWGTDVAVKQLKTNDLKITKQVLEDLQKEIAVLNRLRHPNVVLYIGACTQLPSVCIITEWCSKGSLNDVLHNCDIPLNFDKIVSIALGIARGMNYLHSLERRIIHRDLKSHNVLLDHSWAVKIADFGLSHVRQRVKGQAQPQPQRRQSAVRQAPDEGGHYGILGTPEWMAPEVMEGHRYDEKVDVYSYGIVLCELLTREIPFRDKYQIRCYEDVVDAVLDDGAIPTVPAWAGQQVRDLIVSCLDRDSSQRPSYDRIIQFWEGVVNQRDYENGDWFNEYDVPRLRYMLGSGELFLQLLATRELSTTLANKATNAIKHSDLLAIVGRLTELLLDDHEAVQERAFRAINAILAIPHPEGHTADYREAIRKGNGMFALFDMMRMEHTEYEVKEMIRKILSELSSDPGFMQELHKSCVQLEFTEDSMKRFRAYEDIVKHDLDRLQKRIDEDTEQLKHRTGVLRQIGASKQILDLWAAKQNASKGDKDIGTAAAANPLQAQVIETIPDSSRPPHSFEQYFGTYKETRCGYALEMVNKARKRWALRFLYLFGSELRIYESPESLPEDPMHAIYLDYELVSNMEYGQGLPERCGKAFPILLKEELENTYDTAHIFCFRSSDALKDWIDALLKCDE